MARRRGAVNNPRTNTRPATATTVNAAFALGPSLESTFGNGNGQLENDIRFLEDWNGRKFTYRGSIVDLWHSQQVTGFWRCCGTGGTNYYTAPSRIWSEPGITRSWSITPTGPTVPPNRLATIQVIVRVDRAAATLGAQNITLTTMRAE
jgi:hypothetical protein